MYTKLSSRQFTRKRCMRLLGHQTVLPSRVSARRRRDERARAVVAERGRDDGGRALRLDVGNERLRS